MSLIHFSVLEVSRGQGLLSTLISSRSGAQGTRLVCITVFSSLLLFSGFLHLFLIHFIPFHFGEWNFFFNPSIKKNTLILFDQS